MSRLRTFLGGIVWVAIILVISLGAAGLVTGMDHPPGSTARAELTAAGDAEVTPLLDAAEAKLTAMAAQVDALGTQARGALAALNGAGAASSQTAIAIGDGLVADVGARTAALRRDLVAVPHVGTPVAGLAVSDAVAARHAALLAALDATQGLDSAWARLTIGSVAATRMSELLAEHDRLVGQAADLGVHAKYPEAIELLDQATREITDARILRDQLANTVDVTVLDEWLTRSQAYDVALRNLYALISKAGSKVTPEMQAAVKAEAEARARLPPDTRGLVIIMAAIGRGGMNGAVIAIEETRAKLADAIDAGRPASSAEPGASSGS